MSLETNQLQNISQLIREILISFIHYLGIFIEYIPRTSIYNENIRDLASLLMELGGNLIEEAVWEIIKGVVLESDALSLNPSSVSHQLTNLRQVN